MKRPLLLLLLVLLSLTACGHSPKTLTPFRVIELLPGITEPSDLCIHPHGGSLLIVSDRGLLFHTDTLGQVLATAPFRGDDFEGVYAHGGAIYVADEGDRLVHRFTPDGLRLLHTFPVPHPGKRNSGYEGIAFNRALGVLILIVEKGPAQIVELDADFRIARAIPFAGATDISAVTWHDEHLWLLSDEEQKIMRVDPTTYRVVGEWGIPSVVKPEGMAFLNPSTLLVLCDQEHRLYYLPAP